ncbi:MAG: chlorohydrolase family protein [Burkholderiales bacterium]
MRTLIHADWVVGHRAGHHELFIDGEVVFEDDRLLHVGFGWQGRVDARIEAPGCIVCPGFIDTHVHAGNRALHRLLSDTGRPELLGQPFLEIALRKPQPGGGDARSAPGNANLQATYTVAELLRNGVTGFAEFGSSAMVQGAIADVVEQSGMRAWLGAGFESYTWFADAHGRRRRRALADGGRGELAHALEFADALAGRSRLAPLLVPRDVDTCTPDLLSEVARVSAERDLRVAIHAAYNPWEFYEVLAEHGRTPIELLAQSGLLGPRTLLGHANYLAGPGRMHHSGGRDLELVATSGATVSHCPVNLARRGRVLDHWGSYRAAGVPIALGSDTYPRDMFEQMRAAAIMAKTVARDYAVAPANELFDAATTTPADWLGRADLGRLAAGAQADITIVDLRRAGSLRHGPIRDPVRTLVECAVGDDVRDVFVAGRHCVKEGHVLGMDIANLQSEAQADAESQWRAVAAWDPLGRSADERSPSCFTMHVNPQRRSRMP